MNKYDLIEFGAWGDSRDPRCDMPWKFEGTLPRSPEEEQEYRAHPMNQFGQHLFEKVCLKHKIDAVCVPPGSMVVTEKGNKPIEEIQIGEKVLTHDGTFQKVTKTLRHTHIGKIKKFGICGQNIQLTITDEHPIYVYKKRGQGAIKKSRKQIYDGISPEFIEAKSVQPDDLRTFPLTNETLPTKEYNIVISDYLTKFHIENNQTCRILCKSLPYSIKLDEDFAEFLGYVITDGCISPKINNVTCTFHTEEIDFVHRFIELGEKIFGIKGTYKQCSYQKSINISINSVLLNEFLYKFTNGKMIPWQLFTANKNIKLALIKGLIRGDGHYSKNTVAFDTSKPKLAFDYYWLLSSCGIAPNLGKYYVKCQLSKSKKKRIIYHVNAYAKDADYLRQIVNKYPWEEPARNRKRYTKSVQFLNGYLTSKIRNKATTHYKGQVYNLEVENNNSYVVNNFCVHNCTINDIWVDQFKINSPYRRIYSLLMMSTVDSEPQPPEWVFDFEQVDGFFTYTKWAEDLLRKQSTKIKFLGQASPAADYDVFKPLNKKQIKQHFGLDKFIIGTVMRNQKRKLYPDLIKSFDMLLTQDPNLSDKVGLYLHTSWPDQGWNLPELIKNSKFPKNIYVTYACQACGAVYPSNYSEAVSVCKNCGNLSAILPGSSKGISTEALVQVYNCFDCYVQYHNCFPAGTRIYTLNGWKNIENISIGDKVQTHTNSWKDVVQTFKRQSNHINNIACYASYKQIQSTNEHPFYCYSKEQFSTKNKLPLRELIGNYLRDNKPLPQPHFKKVEDLKIGDLLVNIIDDRVVNVSSVDLSKYVSNSYDIQDTKIVINKRFEHVRHINIDEDFCKFLGLYVADGYSNNGQLRITQNTNEKDNIEFLTNYLSKFGTTNIKPYKSRQALDVCCFANPLAKFLQAECGKKEFKKLPKFVELLPINLQKQILIGLFRGDGCFFKKQKVSIYTTISLNLSNQIEFLLDRIRQQHSIKKVIRSNHKIKDNRKRKDTYRFEVYSDIQNNEFNQIRKGSRNLYIDNMKCMQIKSITKCDFNDFVYNFEVKDDNSYKTELGIVHNCEGFALPLIESAACALPVFAVNYSGPESIIKDIGAYPIEIIGKSLDVDKRTYVAIPDNQDLVNKLRKYFYLPEHEKIRKQNETRKRAMQHYSYDKTAENWAKAIDSMPYANWYSPPDVKPLPQAPNNLTANKLVEWAIINILGRPDLVGTHFHNKYVKDINNQLRLGPPGQPHIKYEPKDMLNEFAQIRLNINKWEELRAVHK